MTKKTTKLLPTLAILLTILFTLSFIGVNDIKANEKDLRFSNINSFENLLSDSGSVNTDLFARNCDKITIRTYLQKYESGSWVGIKSWSKTAYSTNTFISTSYTLQPNSTYRTVAYAYVYDENNTLLESATNTSTTVYTN